MSQTADDYLDSRRKCEKALAEYGDVIDRTGELLIELSNINDVGIDDRRTVGVISVATTTHRVDASEWPTIDRIRDLLTTYTTLRRKQRSIFDSLEQSIKSQLPEPL